jgi:hypothetical protein
LIQIPDLVVCSYADVKSVAKTHLDLLLQQKARAFETEFLQWRSRFLHDKKLLQQWQKCARSGETPPFTTRSNSKRALAIQN